MNSDRKPLSPEKGPLNALPVAALRSAFCFVSSFRISFLRDVYPTTRLIVVLPKRSSVGPHLTPFRRALMTPL
jgi:hypothetical protein